MSNRVSELFSLLQRPLSGGTLEVTSPSDGSVLASITTDTRQTLNQKLESARKAQECFSILPRRKREEVLKDIAAAISEHKNVLAELVILEGGKTEAEAAVEASGAADVMLKTIKDATLEPFNGMIRVKERPAVGVVGLITSFNFPLAVANWTIAPAMLAGNAVMWKPSEKTPLVALAYKAIFDRTAGAYADLLQLAIGGRDVGEAMVAHEGVDMVSATGSVGMGKGIRATLTKKKNNAVPPILELGGNNGVVISEHVTDTHLEFAVSAIMTSFLGTTGQRCTNTRRVFVHQAWYDKAVALFTHKIEDMLKQGKEGFAAYGYGALIDKDAYQRFEYAKQEVQKAGGHIVYGARLFSDIFPHAYYVEPALALLQSQASIMHEETFAPLLYVVPYAGNIDEAMALVNAPANAGLVGGIYTLSQKEADAFSSTNGAGHTVINSSKGTGTPAFGMGFGGNKDSGEGEILNGADPLRPFTRSGRFMRIAQNHDIPMSE